MTHRPTQAPPVSAPEHRESRRFGLEIRRFRFQGLDKPDIETIANSSCDVAIVRVDSSALGHVQRVADRCGEVIVADTLVHYSLPLHDEQRRSPIRTARDVVIRRAEPSDQAQIEAVTRSAFLRYRSHYAANRLFAPEDILDGYVEWTETLLNSDAPYWIASRESSLLGYAAMAEHEDTHTIALNAVRPDAQGLGVYGLLLDHAIDYSSRQGAQVFQSSTQIDNLRVQTAWASRGMRLSKAENTIHVNLLSSECQLSELSTEVCIDRWNSSTLRETGLGAVLNLAPADTRVDRVCERFGATTPEGPLRVSVKLKKQWADGTSLFQCNIFDDVDAIVYSSSTTTQSRQAGVNSP